jgi:hypothetical protein
VIGDKAVEGLAMFSCPSGIYVGERLIYVIEIVKNKNKKFSFLINNISK